jgi:hypothetical protein
MNLDLDEKSYPNPVTTSVGIDTLTLDESSYPNPLTESMQTPEQQAENQRIQKDITAVDIPQPPPYAVRSATRRRS